jgi:hypothetical protein
MSIRETLGLKKKAADKSDYVCPQCGPDARGPEVHAKEMHTPPAGEDFKLTPTEPPGSNFEVGDALGPGRVFRLTQVPQYFRIMGAGTIKEHRRAKRTMRNYLLPVQLLTVNEWGRLENGSDGVLTAHPSLGQILDGCEVGTCVSITCIGDGSQNRYKVNKVKVQ